MTELNQRGRARGLVGLLGLAAAGAIFGFGAEAHAAGAPSVSGPAVFAPPPPNPGGPNDPGRPGDHNGPGDHDGPDRPGDDHDR